MYIPHGGSLVFSFILGFAGCTAMMKHRCDAPFKFNTTIKQL